MMEMLVAFDYLCGYVIDGEEMLHAIAATKTKDSARISDL